MRLKSGIMTICISLLMVFAMMPMNTFQTYAANADSTTTGLVEDGVLDGVKVRIRPTGSFKPLSINEDGSGSQNCVHLYYQGKSSQFYLEKADADSYYIYFYQNYYDETPKTTGDCRLDLEDKNGYDKEGQVIHVVSGNSTAMNKRWQFIRQDDGSYYIRNKLTNKYWTLDGLKDDSNKLFQNNTKLIQSATPIKWDIEIVSKSNDQFKSKVQYDSRNFTYNNTTVSSNNWMGALPDNLKISDISIPGTHDVGSCHLHKSQGSMSTQRYYIDEMLNAGVRHFDIRTGLSGETPRIVHDGCHALDHSENDLTLVEAMDWIIAFLRQNPKEIVIIQPKMDNEGGKCDYLTYKTLEEYALAKGQYIWSGDHVPTLGEARGRILVLSRLNTDNDYATFDYDVPGTPYQWALDLDSWNKSGGSESEDRAAKHTAFGSNYDVWVQDNYKHDDGAKKDFIKKTLYGNTGDGYTNGTQYHYDQSKMNGKDAWILNYTSASHKSIPYKTAFDLCKEIQQWMLDRSDDYNRDSERIIRSDTFTGILAFDYMDGLLSTFIYKTNFKRHYVTVQGVTVDKQKIGKPLILWVGENEDPAKLLGMITDPKTGEETSTIMKRILEGQFNKDGYKLIPASNGEYLTETMVTSQEELNNAAATFKNHIKQKNVASELYVILSDPIDYVEATLEIPVCSKQINGNDDPAPNITVADSANYKVALKDGKPYAHWKQSDFTVESGKYYDERFYLEPKFGYHFADHGSTMLAYSMSSPEWYLDSIDEHGWLSVEATATRAVHDMQMVNQVEPTCTKAGMKAHFKCGACGRFFFDAEGKTEVLESTLVIPPVGHNAGEPVDVSIKTATCTEEGSDARLIYCTRCGEVLSRTPITVPALGHEWPVVEGETDQDGWSMWQSGSIIHLERTCSRCGKETRQYEQDHIHGVDLYTEPGVSPTCTTPGICEHDVCSCGAPINKNSYDSDWYVMTDEELIIPATGHTPMDPVRENESQSTCTTAGGYDEIVRCEVCNAVISNEHVTIEPLKHIWSKPTYVTDWESGSVTAKRICERDESHIETETVLVSEIFTKEPTCEEKGSKYYYAEFENEAFERQQSDEVELEALGHNWSAWNVTKEATCMEKGSKTRSCSRCKLTETEEIPVDPDAHDIYIDLDESTDTATCEEAGRANRYEVCSICDKVISQSRPKTSPLGHSWGEPVYKWSDDMSEVTATRTCIRSGCGEEESETAESTSWMMEDSTCETAGMIKYDAQFESEAFDTQEKAIEVEALGHDWGEWTVTKEATATSSGEKQRVCKRDPSHIEKQTIPAEGYAPGTDPNQKGTDGTAVGPGASAASADKAITGMTNDKDPKGSVYNKVKLRSTKQTKTAITLKWTKPSGAAKFVLYGNMCGTKNKMTKIGTYTGSSKKLTKVAGKKVKKGTYYKFILVALDKNNNVVSTSKVIHIATKGGKVTNPKKVIVKKGKKAVSKVTVKNSKTITVKTTVTKASKKLKLKNHRKVMYESSNKKIATVTSKGKIKGVRKGTCYIYAYAQNGVYKKIKVTVN